MTIAPRMHEAVTEAAAKVIIRRWCSHHQGEVATNAGSIVTRNKSHRWICFRCQEATVRLKSR